MSRRSRREIEDFACQQCGRLVQGDGFTNHCPHCLWSKHVDVYPGDRAENCSGLMAPVALTGNPPKARIKHRCETCGQEKWNRVSTQDSFEALLSLAERQARQA